ncbi:MAG: DUF1638 domain-containing protein [Ardenticatenaceae bacterium]|nr:DUF1638 domain-containing protein [Ardenticatenaceae bacterium]MCB9443354.1 DUF1638 domain-containing protein [Ardenticatenaceae bacterium]
MGNGRTKVIACATVIEEMLPLMPSEIDYEVLDFGLHLVPGSLKTRLQEAIDAACSNYDTLILGYGLCSMAVVGLQSRNCTVVVPRVDDCIACFLGSREAYDNEHQKEPGTYYLTKGWIEVSDTLLDEYNRSVEKYGQERAERIMRIMLNNYKRLVYIDTGTENQDYYRDYARKVAEKFNLRFEEVKGSNSLIYRTLYGPWDDDFVVAQPGQTIKYTDFKTTAATTNNLSLYSTNSPLRKNPDA